jgi:hypothetical protein
MKNVTTRDPEQVAFLMLESPVVDHPVVPSEEKRELETIVKSIAKKLSMIELLGYRVDITVNSHKVFTIKIVRKGRDLDNIVYMKVWDPRIKTKIVALGGWVTVEGRWLWGQYIVVDLTYAKSLDEKQLFDFVKKIISLVI